MIWRRYFFKELFITFLFVLLTLYSLYVLIDYAAHARLLLQSHFRFWEPCFYYLYQFSKHADLLIPITLLISTLKVILTANGQRELLILLAAGVSLKRIARPFLLFGFSIMLLSYLNLEYIQPKIYPKLAEFEQEYHHKSYLSQIDLIHPLVLADHSLLIYQSYHPLQNELIDVFWRKNEEEIYRMEVLQLDSPCPTGLSVDCLAYTKDSGMIRWIKHEENLPFPTMILPQNYSHLFYPPQWQSISALLRLLPLDHIWRLNDKQASAATYFLYKIAMIWMIFIVVTAPLLFTTRFKRALSPLAIYALFLFGYITLFTLLNAFVILGKNQVFHPLVALGLPMGGALLLLMYKYAKF